MDQIEFFDIPSPCKCVCETDKQGYCIGCNRSREERFDWLSYTDKQKKKVLRLCQQRAYKRRYLAMLQQRSPSEQRSSQVELDLIE